MTSTTLPSQRPDTAPSYQESNMLDLFGTPVREVETGVSLACKQRIQGQFLRGPIPLDALATASSLPGQALVLLLVHHRVALTKSQCVTLPKGLLDRFGISRDSKARALHVLEEALLIVVERVSGRSARIKLLAPAKHGG
jgi:hypothetical protein